MSQPTQTALTLYQPYRIMLLMYLVRQIPEWLPATLFDAYLSTLEPPDGGSFFAQFLLLESSARAFLRTRRLERISFWDDSLTVACQNEVR